MIPSLRREDLRIIGFNLSKILFIVSIVMLIPIIVAVIYGEFEIIPHFLIGSSISVILGSITHHYWETDKEMELKHALCFAALTWIVSMLVTAIPLWTTGSTNSYLDANFDTMSGFTTSGLTLVPDIDHLSYSINFYRHFLQFFGGIGIIVISLTVLSRSELSSVLTFKGEARDIGIKPNIVRTARVILGIAIAFMVIGSVLFTAAGIIEGANLRTAIFDGVNYSMAAYSTGGFAPHSQNMLFYHSTLYEVIALIIFLIGSFNFSFHYSILSGRRREIFKNIEIKTFFTILLLSTLVISGLLLFSGVYSTPDVLFRKAFFQAASAQTTTGFGTLYPVQISTIWPSTVVFMMAMLMMIGASANSTAGGIKAIRIGVMVKSFVREIKKALSPRSATVETTYHHVEDTPLTETVAKGAMLIAFSYVLLFIVGTTITMLHGYGMSDSMFETASAVGNTGLSSGITSPAMPDTLKVTYIFLMWAGRLEIMAVLVLIGFTILGIRRGFRK